MKSIDSSKVLKNKRFISRFLLANLIAISISIFCPSFNLKILGVTKPLFRVATPNNQQSFKQFCKNIADSRLFVRTELFFGLGKTDGSEVSIFEFKQFLDREITPKFPDGLTLISGQGQFRSFNKKIMKEPVNLLILIYPFEQLSYSTQKISSIRQSYKRQFKQESVLRSDNLSCVSF